MKEREGEDTSVWLCLLGLTETLRDLRPGKEESHPRGAGSRRVGSRAGMPPRRGRRTGRGRQTGVRTGTEGEAPAAESTQGGQTGVRTGTEGEAPAAESTRGGQTGVRTGTEGVAPAAENTQGEDESRHRPGDSEGAL